MKVKIFGALLVAVASAANAQISQHSNTSRDSNVKSLSSSMNTSVSVGSLFFEPLVQAIKAAPNDTLGQIGCDQILSSPKYSYAVHPELAKLAEGKGRMTGLDENSIALPVSFTDDIRYMNFSAENIGTPISPMNAMLCSAHIAGAIDIAIMQLNKTGDLTFERPNRNQLDSAIKYGLMKMDNSDIVKDMIRFYQTYSKSDETICTIPTYTGIIKNARTFLTCGPYTYQPKPFQFIKNNVVLLDENTIAGYKVTFSNSRSRAKESGQSRERSQKANVSN